MIPRQALQLIMDAEGYHKRLPDGRAAPYLCPANVPTIGYGSTRTEDGRRVTLADEPITHTRALELLAWEVAKCERAVDRLCPDLPPLARGAIVSFAYNLGSGALETSTLRRVVNARRYADVPRELAKWRMGGGVVLPGLVRRRAAEAELFMRGVGCWAPAAGQVAPLDWTATVTG